MLASGPCGCGVGGGVAVVLPADGQVEPLADGAAAVVRCRLKACDKRRASRAAWVT